MAPKKSINLIVPMAGKGKRMLPHTLTTPKPFIPMIGKPIIQRILENIYNLCAEGTIVHIGFVVNDDLPSHGYDSLQAMAQSLGAEVHFYNQAQACGTAAAIHCAAPLLQGPVVVAFSDTLFQERKPLDLQQEGIICVHSVSDPSQYGVVALDQDNAVKAFVEKPTTFVSDLAIIGIYYFQEGSMLQAGIQYLMEQELAEGEEYQLTRVLSYMQEKGTRFSTQLIEAWLDCGNKQATLAANQFFLEQQHLANKGSMVSPHSKVINSTIIPPVYIENDSIIEQSIIGPYVSIGKGTQIVHSQIKNSIIQTHTLIQDSQINSSIIGNYVKVSGRSAELNLGDYNTALI